MYPNHPNLLILVLHNPTRAKGGYYANVVSGSRDTLILTRGEVARDLEGAYLSLLKASARLTDIWSQSLR